MKAATAGSAEDASLLAQPSRPSAVLMPRAALICLPLAPRGSTAHGSLLHRPVRWTYQNAAPLLFRRPNRPERVLPPGTSIVQVYEEANHELLILGEPGVGKSTLLVALAQHLVERAEREETHPLPILLSLLSWAVKRPRMQDWLIEQISQTYGVSRWISQQLVREEQILLLLDGLDEMEETARVACVTEINAYHHEHLLVPLVICSLTAEYERATVTELLSLHNIVVVQPLTSHQFDNPI